MRTHKNHFRISVLVSLFLLCSAVAHGQTEKPVEGTPVVSPPSEFMTAYKKAKLMMLGTFHFNDAGLDGHKPKNLDILGERKQAEILDLVERVSAFKPTIVAIEWLPKDQPWVDSTYREYLAGNFQLRANEVYQVGYRVAEKTGAKLVCVDAKQRMYEDYITEEKLWEIAERSGQGHYKALVEKREAEFKAYSIYLEKLKHEQHTVVEHLTFLNTETYLQYNHGHYVHRRTAIGDHEAYPMADEWTRWYNRNLRIFAHLLRLVETGDERILLLIGVGHVPILKQAAQASPETEYVDVLPYLK